MNEYFIQTDATVGREAFEQVDEFTYKNHAAALKADGTGRYPEGALRFGRADGKVLLDGTPTEYALGVIVRVLGIKVPQGTLAGGPVQAPQYIKFANRVKGGKPFLHEVGGENYRVAA